jgi:hypothetical protein
MIMFEQSRRLSEPLRWGRREKTAVALLLACLLLAAAGLGAYALTSGSSEPAGCIDVTFASTVGGATLHACGARARAVCASPGPYSGIAASLREACTRARLPFAPSGSPG